MKKYPYLTIIVFVVLLFAGCKKDPSYSVPELSGKWVYLDFDNTTWDRYISFVFEEGKYYEMLIDHNYEFKSTTIGTYEVEDDFLRIYTGFNTLYRWNVVEDTLTLTRINNQTIRYLRSNNGPKNINDWHKPATILSSFTDTGFVDAITTYNGTLYALNHNMLYLKKYNLNSGTLSGSINLTTSYNGLEFVQSQLWASNKSSNKLERIDPNSGAVSFSSVNGPFNPLIALYWNGLSLNGFSGYYLYSYNINMNSYTDKSSPANLNDAAFYDNRIYAVDEEGIIHMLNPSTFLELKSWHVPGYIVTGIAFEQGVCWVSAINRIYSQPNAFLKIRLD